MDDYEVIASFYDLEHETIQGDVDMYRQLSRLHSGPVLIAGVGTGRVLIPLAEDGIDVVGVDKSGAMLARCRAKTAGVANLDLIDADICDLTLGQLFSLIIVPLEVFYALATPEDQLRALRSLHDHMDSDAMLIIDVQNPHQLPAESDLDCSQRLRFHGKRDGIQITAWDSVTVDSANQSMVMNIVYDSSSDGQASSREATLDIRWVYQFELRALMELAGLILTHVYGDYDLNAYSAESPGMIATAVRRQA